MDQPPPSNRLPQHEVDERTQAFLTEEMFLRRVIGHRLPGPDAVDDVIQEVAVALTQARDVPREAMRPWLCRVAIRQALLYRRRLGRQRKLQTQYSESGTADSDADERDPLLWMLAGERRQQLQAALSRLQSGEEQILRMKYVDGSDYRRIAGKLQISEHAVANRLRAARQRLRAELERLNLSETPKPKAR